MKKFFKAWMDRERRKEGNYVDLETLINCVLTKTET